MTVIRSLFNCIKDSHPNLHKKDVFKQAQAYWNEIKNDRPAYDAKINELKAKITKQKSTMLSFLSRRPVQSTTTASQAVSTSSASSSADTQIDSSTAEPDPEPEPEPIVVEDEDETTEVQGSSTTSEDMPKTPHQLELEQKIDSVGAKLKALYQLRLSCVTLSTEQKAEVKKLESEEKDLQKKLRKSVYNVDYKKRTREERKRTLEEVFTENPEVAEKLRRHKPREKTGRPALEESMPELPKTIVDIVLGSSTPDDRRRSELIQSVKTLDDLCKQLDRRGICVSRSGVYLRLLPKRWNTIEGKCHVDTRTVPVKLAKPQTVGRKGHIDAHFASATIKFLKELCSFFGSDACFFLSQDDKARVPLGLPAVNKQAPILMHLDYRVELPDHDWVVATRHKLIPSVYAACVISSSPMKKHESDNNITYSGPTYIAIRSGKHDSSTAQSYLVDFRHLIDLEEFSAVAKTQLGLFY